MSNQENIDHNYIIINIKPPTRGQKRKEMKRKKNEFLILSAVHYIFYENMKERAERNNNGYKYQEGWTERFSWFLKKERGWGVGIKDSVIHQDLHDFCINQARLPDGWFFWHFYRFFYSDSPWTGQWLCSVFAIVSAKRFNIRQHFYLWSFLAF